MANDWIIDVIADLKTYAETNGLSELADQLGDATLIAATEIASEKDRAPEMANWEVGNTKPMYRPIAERESA